MCFSGCARQPNTVTMGQVETRVCLRGSFATTSHQRSNLSCVLPLPWRESYSPVANIRAPAMDFTASRSAIFSKEKIRKKSGWSVLQSAQRVTQLPYSRLRAAMLKTSPGSACGPIPCWRSTCNHAPTQGRFRPGSLRERNAEIFGGIALLQSKFVLYEWFRGEVGRMQDCWRAFKNP
jgi:hypothetical protein